MNDTQGLSAIAPQSPRPQAIDMKLEVVVIPVADVDRAKSFYNGLRWRLDADFTTSDDWRVIQFTPPGSGCSVIFGNCAHVRAHHKPTYEADGFLNQRRD